MSEGHFRKIDEKGTDYARALKDNQATLHTEVSEMFDEARRTGLSELEGDWFETVGEKSRIRVETRRCWTVSNPEYIGDFNDRGRWSNLRSVVMVESECLVYGKRTREVRYYISCLVGDAKRMLEAARGHWETENCVHWSLDVSF